MGKGTWNNDQGNGRKGRDRDQEHLGIRQCLTSPAWRLEHTLTLTHGLEVECHHLTADIPEHLGLVIGGVHPGAFGVNAAHLPLVVSTGSIGNTVPVVPWGQLHIPIIKTVGALLPNTQSLPDKTPGRLRLPVHALFT